MTREEVNTPWNPVHCQVLTSNILEALMEGRIPAVQVEPFCNANQMTLLQKAISPLSFEDYVVPPVGRVGPSHYEFRENLEKYLALSAGSKHRFEKLWSESFDVIAVVKELLKEASGYPVEVAKSEDGHEYSTCVIRKISYGALPHVDYAPYDVPDWSVGRISHQLSWNLYVSTPDCGGEIKIYNRCWQKSDLGYREQESYAYSRDLFRDCQNVTIHVKSGDFLLINPRYYHEVIPSGPGQNRITISSFAGLFDSSNSWVLWA